MLGTIVIRTLTDAFTKFGKTNFTKKIVLRCFLPPVLSVIRWMLSFARFESYSSVKRSITITVDEH